ncbi:transmembrane protein 100-like [Tiliqua scincoides]|uniref:transmembrane protein 100-like n=1 Tax=Tiliqua scincoides TaxID=71010 RepID=UPI0034630E04
MEIRLDAGIVFLATMSYDHVTVNMEREEVCLERAKSCLDPRLVSTTTGGVEASCPDCLLPFGLVVGIIGLAATSVACVHDPPGSVLSILGWLLLGVGVLGMGASCLWRHYRKRKRKQRRGSWSMLVGETEAKKVVV